MRFITKTNKYDPAEQLTTNFKMKEFASPDGFVIWTPDTEKFLDMVQAFRKWLNKPIAPSSMYRTPEHNKKIGGASNSPHMTGMAIDIPWSGVKPEYLAGSAAVRKKIEDNIAAQWKKQCAAAGIKGGGLELCPRHFHLDIMPRTAGFKVWRGESK